MVWCELSAPLDRLLAARLVLTNNHDCRDLRMECLPCDRCREVDWAEYRNKNCAIMAGALFTVGWWLALGEATQSEYFYIYSSSSSQMPQ